jgi:hypothetical protein
VIIERGGRMNVNTGEFREFDTEDEIVKAVESGNWVRVKRHPKKGCKWCLGRGYEGTDIKTGRLVPCRCVM